MVSAALVVCLTLVIPAATGVDAQMPENPSVVATPTQPLATAFPRTRNSRRSPAVAAVRSEDGFQAFAVEEDLKISPKQRAAAPAAVPAAARFDGRIQRRHPRLAAARRWAHCGASRRFASGCRLGRSRGEGDSTEARGRGRSSPGLERLFQRPCGSAAGRRRSDGRRVDAQAQICRARGHDRRSDRSRPGPAVDVRGARNCAAGGRQSQRGDGAGADVGGRFCQQHRRRAVLGAVHGHQWIGRAGDESFPPGRDHRSGPPRALCARLEIGQSVGKHRRHRVGLRGHSEPGLAQARSRDRRVGLSHRFGNDREADCRWQSRTKPPSFAASSSKR